METLGLLIFYMRGMYDSVRDGVTVVNILYASMYGNTRVVNILYERYV